MIRDTPEGMPSLEERLEALFADRGLKFTTPISTEPGKDTHGVLDGVLLRFVLRPVFYAIVTGTLNEEDAHEVYDRKLEKWYEGMYAFDREVIAGKHSPEKINEQYDHLIITKPELKLPDGINDRPYRLELLAYEKHRSPMIMAKDFTEYHVEDIFTRLMERLAPFNRQKDGVLVERYLGIFKQQDPAGPVQ